MEKQATRDFQERASARSCGQGLLALLLLIIAAPLCAASDAEDPLAGLDRTLLGAPADAPRHGEALDEATSDLASRMRCPVCQGLSIEDSPSASAVAMKKQVRQLLAQGYSKSQVLEYFEASFGEFVRLEPKMEGFNLFAWFAPAAALLVGLVAVFATVLRTRRRAAAVLAAEEEDLRDYRARVRREADAQ